MKYALELRNVEKRYVAPDGMPVVALRVGELTLACGTERALAGPSGSGKTTLLHLASGLLLPSAGEVRVLGKTISGIPEAERDRFRARSIGYVFQRANLLDGFSALENVLLPMEFAGIIPAKERKRHAQHLLQQVGLSDRLNFRPSQLSSGQQQRVAVARALANNPALVLADEPTASVDEANGQQIVALLREFCAERDAALLFVSHDQTLLQQFNRVATLRGGMIEEASSQKPEARMMEVLDYVSP